KRTKPRREKLWSDVGAGSRSTPAKGQTGSAAIGGDAAVHAECKAKENVRSPEQPVGLPIRSAIRTGDGYRPQRRHRQISERAKIEGTACRLRPANTSDLAKAFAKRGIAHRATTLGALNLLFYGWAQRNRGPSNRS